MSSLGATHPALSPAIRRQRDAAVSEGVGSEARTSATAVAGVVASLLGTGLIVGAPWHFLAFAGAMTLACVPTGAAVMCWLDSGDNVAQSGLTLTISLAAFALGGATMIWFAAWHPHALLALAGVGLLSCSARLATGPRPAIRRPRVRIPAQFAILAAGLCAWAYGLDRLHQPTIGSYGLLASSNVWFVLGIALLVVGFVFELRRAQLRIWLLGVYLVALIVAIHSTVPIMYGSPEYAWVYKHIGVIQSLGHYGRVTDSSDIYQQWPALFAGAAAIASLGHIGPMSYATWGPLWFELADALLLLGLFRLLAGERRVAYLAVLLFTGLISWVGQDYLSPQAFSYLLWLGLLLILLRWLRRPSSPAAHGRLARLRAPLLAGLQRQADVGGAARAAAVALVALLYFAIVAAHQLTPYAALAGVGALTILDLLRPRWLLLLLAAIAGAYLAPRYGLISHNFGGLFSGGNPIANASGARGTYHSGPQATTATIVRGLAAAMWVGALLALALLRQRRSLGKVAIPAALAFSPFLILGAQSYGGEAIYRVYLFSAPWCALLIAQALSTVSLPRRLPVRWPLAGAVSLAVLFAGLQGLYGPVPVDAFTRSELNASSWLYAHAPRGSMIVLPVDNFPALDVADYSAYDLELMPSDPQLGASWLDEGNLSAVQTWIATLGHSTGYLVVSRSMSASATYYGAPRGYHRLVATVPTALRTAVVYHNADVTIYRLSVG